MSQLNSGDIFLITSKRSSSPSFDSAKFNIKVSCTVVSSGPFVDTFNISLKSFSVWCGFGFLCGCCSRTPSLTTYRFRRTLRTSSRTFEHDALLSPTSTHSIHPYSNLQPHSLYHSISLRVRSTSISSSSFFLII